MRALIVMLGFFSALPVPKGDFDESHFKWGIYWIPFIGLLFSGILFTVSLIDLPFRGFLLALLYVLLMGGLHLDGFSDTVDGILSRRPREEKLRIMRDPNMGTFAAVALFFLLLGYVFFLEGSHGSLLLFPLVGRLSLLVAILPANSARAKGLGALFIKHKSRLALLLYLIPTLIFFMIYMPLGLIAILLSLLWSLLVESHCKSMLGGMTGDTLGFVIESSQFIYLLVLGVILWY